jgi:hypothetical protein
MKSLPIAAALLAAACLTGCTANSIAPAARGQSSAFESFSFRRIGTEGGDCLYVRGDGRGFCQTVRLDERDNRVEQRYSLNLNQWEMDRLTELLTIYDVFRMRLAGEPAPRRSAVTTIAVTSPLGRNELEGNDYEPHGGFQALRIQLREYIHEVAERRTPIRTGRFEEDWRPADF